jgi:hypothetical protein
MLTSIPPLGSVFKTGNRTRLLAGIFRFYRLTDGRKCRALRNVIIRLQADNTFPPCRRVGCYWELIAYA